MNARGFTLLEVIVALVILAFLSLMTVQAIQKALQTKTKVQKNIDRTSALHDALSIMQRDINLAFNYRDVSIKLYNDAQDVRRKGTQPQPSPGTPGTPATPPAQPTPPAVTQPGQTDAYAHKTEKIATQFLGKADGLDFTSLSNVRMMTDSPISSQAEIGYHLKPCRRRSDQRSSSQCLWRRTSNYLHPDDITKDGTETVLLENVTEFKLRYLGPGHQEEWIDTWMTDEHGDDTTKGKFPYAVEVTLSVQDKTTKEKPLKMTMVAAIRNPNNPPETNANGSTPNATPNP